ncbi:type VI secretion system contractile sheath domain-containing protein, partial [Cronobacter dublinensis]
MLMSVQNTPSSAAGSAPARDTTGSVYASLFDKINLEPVTSLGDIDAWQDSQSLADASAGERVTAAVQVFLERLKRAGQQVDRLDKTLLDHHIADLDWQISRQLDAVMHHPEFQKVESLWRGLKHLVDRTDYRQNVRTEILDIAKEDLRQDFEDAPEIVQSGLYWHTYTAEYDTPGGEPVGAVISAYEFDA